MLISAIMAIMSIYRLPHGQYGYSGHVVNLPRMCCHLLPASRDYLLRLMYWLWERRKTRCIKTSVCCDPAQAI